MKVNKKLKRTLVVSLSSVVLLAPLALSNLNKFASANTNNIKSAKVVNKTNQNYLRNPNRNINTKINYHVMPNNARSLKVHKINGYHARGKNAMKNLFQNKFNRSHYQKENKIYYLKNDRWHYYMKGGSHVVKGKKGRKINRDYYKGSTKKSIFRNKRNRKYHVGYVRSGKLHYYKNGHWRNRKLPRNYYTGSTKRSVFENRHNRKYHVGHVTRNGKLKVYVHGRWRYKKMMPKNYYKVSDKNSKSNIEDSIFKKTKYNRKQHIGYYNKQGKRVTWKHGHKYVAGKSGFHFNKSHGLNSSLFEDNTDKGSGDNVGNDPIIGGFTNPSKKRMKAMKKAKKLNRNRKSNSNYSTSNNVGSLQQKRWANTPNIFYGTPANNSIKNQLSKAYYRYYYRSGEDAKLNDILGNMDDTINSVPNEIKKGKTI